MGLGNFGIVEQVAVIRSFCLLIFNCAFIYHFVSDSHY